MPEILGMRATPSRERVFSFRGPFEVSGFWRGLSFVLSAVGQAPSLGASGPVSFLGSTTDEGPLGFGFSRTTRVGFDAMGRLS